MTKNNKGFTILELIVSFTLGMIIMFFLFEIILSLKELYVSSGTKTELLMKQAIISRNMNDEFKEKNIKMVLKCGSNCLTFIFEDNSSSMLKIDTNENTFMYGSYKIKLTNGTSFGDVEVKNNTISGVNEFKNDSYLSIHVPMYNKLLKGTDYGATVVYQYNSRISSIGNVVYNDQNTTSSALMMKGDVKVTIPMNDTYNDVGYFVYQSDGSITDNSSSVEVTNPFLNMSTPYTPGNYQVVYQLKDSSGTVIETKTRIVTVREKYSIELVGAATVYAVRGQTYADAGYAIKNSAGTTVSATDANVYVKTKGISTDTNSTQVLTYTLIDRVTGATLGSVQRNVIVDTYTIAINGKNPFYVVQSGTYTEPGYIVKNSVGTDITSSIATYGLSATAGGTVTVGTAGNYTRTYTLKAGSTTLGTATRTVTVVAKTRTYAYKGSVQSATLTPGSYKLEVWGAQGGYRSSTSYGGLGGYAVGTLKVTATTTVYIYVGASGNNGGWNGGGSRTTYKGGGGATDIRTVNNSDPINSASLLSRFIVAGGGGSDGATSKTGMYGGGTSGGSNTANYGTGGGGASQTAGGTGSSSASGTGRSGTYGAFGIGGTGYNASSGYAGAGGGGWYGGAGSYPDGSVDDDRGGGGGSGFVWTSGTASSVPSGYSVGTGFYLTSASTTAGNASFPNTAGSGNETGHSGDGYAKITTVSVTN